MHHHSGYRSYQPRTICNQLFSSHGEDVELGAVHREGRYPGALPRESNLYALTAFFLLLRPSHSAVRRLQRRSEAYTITTEKLVALRELVYEAKGVLIPCLNLGGGFPSSVKLHGTPEDFKIPAIEEYAEAITKVLNRLPKRQRPQLRLETGRHLIDDAGYLISTVCAVKGIDRIKGVPNVGKRARGGYILDAGLHLLYVVAWCRINAMPTAPSPPTLNNTVKLYGCLCMNVDVIREQVDLPPLDVNDRVVLHPVGAYNLTQSMQFINLRPAVVLVGRNGSVDVIRRRERLIDIENGEQVPPYLQLKAA